MIVQKTKSPSTIREAKEGHYKIGVVYADISRRGGPSYLFVPFFSDDGATAWRRLVSVNSLEVFAPLTLDGRQLILNWLQQNEIPRKWPLYRKILRKISSLERDHGIEAVQRQLESPYTAWGHLIDSFITLPKTKKLLSFLIKQGANKQSAIIGKYSEREDKSLEFKSGGLKIMLDNQGAFVLLQPNFDSTEWLIVNHLGSVIKIEELLIYGGLVPR